MLNTAGATVASTRFGGLAFYRSEAIDGRPGRLKRIAAYAGELGRTGQRLAAANDLWEAAGGGGEDPANPEWWDRRRGPSAERASVVLEKRCHDEFIAGQADAASAALRSFLKECESPQEYILNAAMDFLMGSFELHPEAAVRAVERCMGDIDRDHALQLARVEHECNYGYRKPKASAHPTDAPIAPIPAAPKPFTFKPTLELSQPSAWPNGEVPAKVKAKYGMLRWLDYETAADFTPPTWLIKGLVPRAGLGLLYGESGAGKTFLAVHAALSVAWGLPFFQSKVKRGGVLYVAAEGGASVITRIGAAERQMQGAIAAANLTRPKGDSTLAKAPIRVVTEAPNLSRDGSPLPLVRTVEQAKEDMLAAGERLALVVIDTWHAAMGGADENSASDAGAALAPLRELAEAHDFMVLIIHHPGKDVDRGPRGSNAVLAAVDASIELRVPGCEGAKPKSGAMRQATVIKMRDGESGGQFHYRLPTVQIGVDEDGDPWTTCYVQPCDVPKLDDGKLTGTGGEFMRCVYEALAEADGQRAPLPNVRLRFNAGRRDAKPEAVRKAWGRAISDARRDGLIETDDGDQMIWVTSPND